MEWIKKNKVLVSVVGVGLVIVAVIISVMLLMPKADRPGSDDDLTGDMPENLIWDKPSGEITEGTAAEVHEDDIQWGDNLDIKVPHANFDLVINSLRNTVQDEYDRTDKEFMTAGNDYVVVDLSITPTGDSESSLPRFVCTSDVFETTASGDYLAMYVENEDVSGDGLKWSYVNPEGNDTQYTFEKDKKYHVVGVWRMKENSDVTKEEMLDQFSFSVSDFSTGDVYGYTVPRDPEVVKAEEELEAKLTQIEDYYARAYTCIPSSYYDNFENSDIVENVVTTRIVCALAEKDGVDLGIEWDNPDYYKSTLGDITGFDFESYRDFDLETCPEGMYDSAGELTEAGKAHFKEINGVDYDDFIKQQEEEFQKKIDEAIANGEVDESLIKD